MSSDSVVGAGVEQRSTEAKAPVMSKEDFAEVQLSNLRMKNLQLEFEKVTLEAQALADRRARLEEERVRQVQEQSKLVAELNNRYGVDLNLSQVDDKTREIRPATVVPFPGAPKVA